LIHKDSTKLLPHELQQLMQCQCGELLKSENPLLRRWAVTARSQLLKPVQLVDYRRQAFICRNGNVRVTLDSCLRAPVHRNPDSLFDFDIPSLPVLPPGLLILEVKYDAFIPDTIRHLLQLRHRPWQAASKYVLCCTAAQHAKENYTYAKLS
jgi:hypothetical protein